MEIVRDKVALITGGAGGIGSELARVLLKNGLKSITIVDVNTEAGNQAVNKINKEYSSDSAIFVYADVSDIEQLKEAFEKTIEKFKQLDIVINNAGIINEKDWKNAISINCNGVVNGTMLASYDYLPKFKSGDEGIIINMSSVGALEETSGLPMLPIYCSTKSFVLKFSRKMSLADTNINNKIRLLTLCPGLTDTTLLDQEEGLKKISTLLGLQSASHVAQELMTVLKNGTNGSVWIISDGNEAVPVDFNQ